jgi:hypothetical protein
MAVPQNFTSCEVVELPPALASTFHWKFWQGHCRPFVPCDFEPRKLIDSSQVAEASAN